MNMKSKFFGLNAKLALAVLAVGTMFTSCYDSENGDVVKPYEPLPATYYVMGTITDATTGAALPDAQVTVNDAGVELNASASYSVAGKAGDNTVTVQLDGYNEDQTVTRTVNIPTLSDGQSYTAVVNVALTPNAGVPALEVEVKVVPTTTTQPVVLTSAENVGLDLIAEEEAAVFTRNFVVDAGYGISKETLDYLTEATPEMQAYIEAYFGVNLGEYGEYSTLTLPYTFQIPAWNCLQSITINYTYNNFDYTFTANTGEVCNVEVNSVAGYAFSAAFLPNHNYTHSHGHGHGHGENLNAGGGIITPEL